MRMKIKATPCPPSPPPTVREATFSALWGITSASFSFFIPQWAFFWAFRGLHVLYFPLSIKATLSLFPQAIARWRGGWGCCFGTKKAMTIPPAHPTTEAPKCAYPRQTGVFVWSLV